MASPDSLAAAMRLLVQGAWRDAEVAAREAIAGSPDQPAVLSVLGLAIAAMGETARAAPILLRAGVLRPDDEHPCVDLGRLTPPLPRPLVARQYRECLRLAPWDHRLRLAFAEFLLDIGEPGESEAILAPGPQTAAAAHLIGLARAEQGKFVPAIESFRRAVALNPDAAASWSNLGMMLKIEGFFKEAFAAHDRALALDPHDARFRVNKAVALLKAGHWKPAWRDYEARFRLAATATFDRRRLMPSLRADSNLHGRTIIAMHEDGFGDTLQFLRYIPLLAERGMRVLACVPPALTRVMQGVPGVAEVVTAARPLPAHDFVCPMFSLPRVFGTTVQTVPPVPAMRWDKALERHWARQLPCGGLRVGLVWAGQARPSLPGFGTLDRRRSAGLAAFQPLLDLSGIAFVSLQAGPPARQPRPPGLELFDPMPNVTDFADTAAIIAGLDVVVSVDTSVVHLAGLVGKPVFLLDRYDGCWRWLDGRLDSPWYPKLTIFRQERPDDWTGPMRDAASSLRAISLFRGFTTVTGGVREDAFVA